MTKQFNITGMVLGNLWMGGTGSYPLKKFTAKTKKEAIATALDKLCNNKLTGTGDFNGEIGAMLRIECITTRVIKGKEYTNKEQEPIEFIGQMTEEQEEFLMEHNF